MALLVSCQWCLPQKRLRPRQAEVPLIYHPLVCRQMNLVSEDRRLCHQPPDYPVPGEIQDVQVSEEHLPTAAKLLGASSSSSLVIELHLQVQVRQRWIRLHSTSNLCQRRRRPLHSTHLHLTAQEMGGMWELVVAKVAKRRQQPKEGDLWRQRLFR